MQLDVSGFLSLEPAEVAEGR